MQREIKFRVWNGEAMISPDYVDRKGTAFWKENGIPNYSDKVMQYIGQEDKNEIEICEGDIDRSGNVVMWSNKHCLFCLHYYQQFYNRWVEASYPIDASSIEVIGNIYESPNANLK